MITNTAYYRAIKLISANKILAFTDHPTDIEIDDTTYSSIDTIRVGDVEDVLNLKYTYTTFITHFKNKFKDILEYPEQFLIEIFNLKVINNVPKTIQLKIGKIDNLKIEHNKLIIEFTSITKNLARTPTNKYLSTCKACFGDSKCGLKNEDYIIKNILITNITKDWIEIDRENVTYSPKLKNIHKFDIDRIATGGYILDKDGITNVRVLSLAGYQLRVVQSHVKTKLKVGDIINLQCICTKFLSDCKKLFNNQKRFVGEIYNNLPSSTSK